jgi:hypothetical protein
MDEVDDAAEVSSAPIGNLHRNGIGPAGRACFDRPLEVGADAVHLVDERDAGNVYLSACRQTVSDWG